MAPDSFNKPGLWNRPQPTVSIIIRTYNRLSLLKEAVESVRAQTYTNWELIIVDDGSTDGTPQAIELIGDPRILLLRLTHTGNINYLINEGVRKAHGEWLAFLDSDDCWLPEKLELQLKTLSATQRKWCYCPFDFVDENNQIIYSSSEKFLPFEGSIVKEIIQAKTGITICSVIVERKLFNEIGGFSTNPELREDYEFFLRIASRAEVAFTSQVLTRIREHPGRVYKSRKYPYDRTALAYKTFISQRPHKHLKKLAKKQVAHLLAEAAVQRFSTGQIKKGMHRLLQSLIMKDNARHWLSACKRSMLAGYKSIFN